VRGITRQNPFTVIYIAHITAVEVTCAVARRRKGKTLTPLGTSMSRDVPPFISSGAGFGLAMASRVLPSPRRWPSGEGFPRISLPLMPRYLEHGELK
jgi:hypothetical protein